MTIYLYIKKCSHCNLHYFGRTIRNPLKYKGSGSHWKNHIKKYNSIPETIQTFSFDSQEEASNFALKFSFQNNIVKSNEWANLIKEDAKPPRFKIDNIKKRMKNNNPCFLPENVEKKTSKIKAINIQTNQEIIIENRKIFSNQYSIPYTSIGWAIQHNKILYSTWKFEYIKRRISGS